MEPIRSYIPRTRQISVGKARPIIYEVVLAYQGKQWTIERRYSEFHALHKAIGGQIPGNVAFPGKKMVKNKDPKFIQARRKALEEWLAAVLEADGVSSNRPLLEFLEINKQERKAKSGSFGAGPFSPALDWTDRTGGGGGGGGARGPGKPGNPFEGDIPDLNIDVTDSILSGVQAAAIGTPEQLRRLSLTALHFGSQGDLTPQEPAIPPFRQHRRPSKDEPFRLTAISTYNSGQDGDLAFAQGDQVTITGVDDGTGWWIGTVDGINYGLVPMNHVSDSPGGEDAASPASPVPPASSLPGDDNPFVPQVRPDALPASFNVPRGLAQPRSPFVCTGA